MAFSAVWVAVDTGLFESDVLSTLPSPISPLTRVTAPDLPATELTPPISTIAAVPLSFLV
ncbi:MAG: hypothetical protein B7Y80_20550 [Hyphomicrobium sp. 32-62-53]|nr:MAG: hypothetical protein B7Y80_20550 [Hyphomicrobium sp. 32-62-53]